MRRSTTETIIAAMRILAEDIQSEDGVANMAIAEAADRLEELKAAVKKPCRWSRDENLNAVYDGTCGVTWEFYDGGPRENDFKHCPRCGGRIKVKKCTT